MDKGKKYHGKDRYGKNNPGSDKGGFKKKFGKHREDDTKRSFKKENNSGDTDKPHPDSRKTERPTFSDKPKRIFKKENNSDYSGKQRRTFSKPGFDKKRTGFKKHESPGFDKKSSSSFENPNREKKFDKDKRFYKKDFTKKKEEKPTYAEQGLIRLNRYISNAGICSRREADDLITSGCITVNGKKITELGFKVQHGDVVNYEGSQIKSEKHIYLLLNKPKDYITTVEDELGRRTVMELVDQACKERIYPVGRLDRNTTGLLLFTNNGELTKKLTHPKHRVQKLYHVELNKNLRQEDFNTLQNGIELDDGFIKPDEVAWAGESKREVGILIHSGRNRIVRRIFEKLGYDVVRLDRTMFAGLTKKDLPRGKWRFLNEKEIGFLKMV